MFEKIQDADCAFVLDLLQHAVNDNVGSGAANPCTEEQSAKQYEHWTQKSNLHSAQGLIISAVPAVHQNGAHVCGASRRRAVDEGEDGEGVLWYSHVRPLSVVILDHDALI